MTKLALAAVVVALGLAAQAEMLYWKASDIASSADNKLTKAGQYIAYIFADTGSGPKTGDYAAYMFYSGKGATVTSLSTIKGMLASGDDITSLAYYNSNGIRSYETTKGRLNTYSNGTASYNYQVGSVGVGGTINLFAVILDGTSFGDAENYMIARTTAGEEVLTQKTNSNVENPITTVYFDWGSQAGNKWYAIGTAIPEPTSGVLLLVGVAALALKRKKAA